MPTLSRRRVLGWLGLVGLLPAVSWRLMPRADDRDFGLRLAAIVSYPVESARVIGAVYLESAPHEDAADFLRGALVDTAVLTRRAGTVPSDEAVARRFRERVREDFESNDVVSVRGWVLSRTEARLCALISLKTAAA